jgi:hypothetical protein
VVIHFQDSNSENAARAALKDKISNDRIVVKDKTVLLPRLIIFIVPSDTKIDEIGEALNAPLAHVEGESKHTKHVRTINTRSNEHKHQVFELSAKLFNKHMDNGSILLGEWSSCRLEEARRVLQCTRCGAFNHRAATCVKAAAGCLHCASHEHVIRECPHKGDTSKHKCLNCPNAAHASNSTRCPFYMREVNRAKTLIQYV